MTGKKVINLDGWIADYWEQGMERMPMWIFQDARFCTNRTDGWKIDGMNPLLPGHHLEIFDDDNCVLWEGVIKIRKVGFLGLKTLYPNAYEWCPEDVEFETWKIWFKTKPSLKAKLTFSDDK